MEIARNAKQQKQMNAIYSTVKYIQVQQISITRVNTICDDQKHIFKEDEKTVTAVNEYTHQNE